MVYDLLAHSSAATAQFSELCNAMYERELKVIASEEYSCVQQVQGKLKSLPYYIKRTADSMLAAESPLLLDLQNASWSMKQAKQLPSKEQTITDIQNWYQINTLVLGLVVPVLVTSKTSRKIIVDCIDKIDTENSRFRTNYCGWFNVLNETMHQDANLTLLKPTKKVFVAACSGHQWQGMNKTQPLTLSLRELLLSCQINWRNLRVPTPLNVSVF